MEYGAEQKNKMEQPALPDGGEPHILAASHLYQMEASPLYYQMEASPLYIYIYTLEHSYTTRWRRAPYIYIYTGALIHYQMEASPQLDMVVEPRFV